MAVDKRKYLMAKLSAAQYEVEFLKEGIASLDAKGGGGATSAKDLADEPANKSAAKQAVEKSKAKAKPAPAPEVEEPAEDAPAEDDGLGFLEEDAATSGAPTEDDLKTSIKKFAAAFGREKVVALLAKFKAKAIQDVKAEKYEELITLVETALKKHKK